MRVFCLPQGGRIREACFRFAAPAQKVRARRECGGARAAFSVRAADLCPAGRGREWVKPCGAYSRGIRKKWGDTALLWDFLCAVFGKFLFFTSAVGGKGSFPKPLPPEEEEKYLRLAREGDRAARDMLVRHNMRLVAHIVKKYAGAAETDDLISVGSIGLLKAIETFKPSRGTRLATYTARCIENEILMLIRSNKKHRNTVYLSDPVGVDKEGNELTLMDLLFEKEDGVFKEVESRLEHEKFLRMLQGCLTEREYTVLCLRYGLKGGAPMPQREVALFLKISRSYISRIEKRAVEKARAALNRADYL